MRLVLLVLTSLVLFVGCKDKYGFDEEEEKRLVREAFAANGITISEDMDYNENPFYFAYNKRTGKSKLRYEGEDLTNFEPLSKVKSLSRLTLPHTGIRNLNGIGRLRKLEEIYIKNTPLSSIPDEIKFCTKLRKAVFMSNAISEISSGIGELQNIDTLFLDYNDLKSVPKEVLKLKNLKVLSIAKNELETIDFVGNTLNNIEELVLSLNRLRSFPSELYQLPQLKRLYINDNLIDTLTIDKHRLSFLEQYKF